MTRRLQTGVALAILLLFISGCKKKQKPVAVAVPAPTISAPLPTAPVPETKTTTTTTSDKPPVVAEAAKPKPKPKPKPPKRVVVKAPPEEPAKPPADSTVAKAAPPRIVVQPANTPPGQPTTAVVPDMSHTEEAHTRQTTDQLMQSTEANLRSLKRVLNPEERTLLQQINLFMAQSREASQAQDLVRAHNLAMKAHLLSDELVR